MGKLINNENDSIEIYCLNETEANITVEYSCDPDCVPSICLPDDSGYECDPDYYDAQDEDTKWQLSCYPDPWCPPRK